MTTQDQIEDLENECEEAINDILDEYNQKLSKLTSNKIFQVNKEAPKEVWKDKIINQTNHSVVIVPKEYEKKPN
jgi:hypothetical protein